MSTSPATPNSLQIFAQCLKKVPDPRSKHGKSHQFSTILALVFLGLIANVTTTAELQRWAKNHLTSLRTFLRFRYHPTQKQWCVPHAITFARVLRTLSLSDLQQAFAEFINALFADTSLVGAVDGKAAKQMKDADGNPILMLNVFAQKLKQHLASWSVDGDKTNEPGCLKKHLEELFTMYPCLKLLTGDAMFAQRPLLEALREYERDYLVQVKENQPKVLAKMKEVFKDAPQQKPNDCWSRKKRGLEKHVVCG